MNTIKWLGIFFLAAGLCVLGYQGIESIMTEGEVFKNYTLVDMFGSEVFAWHTSIPLRMIEDGINYAITMPAYGLFLIIGVFFLVISGIFSRR